MKVINTVNSWGWLSQGFHWLIALLIFAAIALGLIADDMPDSSEKIRLFMFHKSLGITVLVLAVLRLLWKLLTPQPEKPEGVSKRNYQLAQLGHLGLYGLMFALPLSGWIINSAANFPFQWMNLFPIPDLPAVPASWQHAAADAHWYLFLLLALMVLGHGFMALYHHHVHGNSVLICMLPSLSPRVFFSAFFAILFASVAVFYQAAHYLKTAFTKQQVELVAVQAITAPEKQTNQQWQVLAGNSTLMFVGRYDGADVDGAFKAFDARLFFDPDVPETGFFDVNIDTASVTTYSDEWDSSLPDEEWFFVSQFPQATYKAVRFTKSREGYIAEGVLSLKGISQPVPLSFTWNVQGDNQVRLQGNATVNRSIFGIGSGTWAEDPTIAFEVQVRVDLLLSLVQ